MNIVRLACFLVAVGLIAPAKAHAQLVTFKATGSVGHVESFGMVAPDVLQAFRTRFPLGTPVEMTFSFDPATPDAFPSAADAGVYNGAVMALTVTVGDYTVTMSAPGTMGVYDNKLWTSTFDAGCPPPPSYQDEYVVESSGSWTGEAISGFSPSDADLYLTPDCRVTDWDSWLNGDQLPTTPPQVVPFYDGSGIFLSWSQQGVSGAVEVYAPITSLAVPPNTASGTDVEITPEVELPDGSSTSVSLTFDSVETAGDTTVTATADAPPAPSGFKVAGTYYDISTSATFAGQVRVCLSWVEGQVSDESAVQVFHYKNGSWVDITDPLSRDTVNNTVCGVTDSFSPFGIFEVKFPFVGFFAPVENAPTVNAVKAGAAVPVKFSLGSDRGLGIFKDGFPRTQLMQCDTLAPVDEISETVSAGGSSLSYDASTDQYTYVWKTDKAWGGSCRELQIKLTDGEVYTARFTLRK